MSNLMTLFSIAPSSFPPLLLRLRRDLLREFPLSGWQSSTFMISFVSFPSSRFFEEDPLLFCRDDDLFGSHNTSLMIFFMAS